ncbi:cytochrome P450 [Aspergillus carlsbadensis]|nr:cytochrome P450 [Aspergillus carlsbadensis]
MNVINQDVSLLALYILIAALILRTVYAAQRGPLSKLPGPEISKWTSLVVTYHWLLGQRIYYIASLHDKYGPVVRVSPSEVDFADVAVTRELHRVGTPFVKAQFYKDLVPLGQNVFAQTDPKRHAERRRLLASPISDSSLTRFESVVDSKVRLALDRAATELETRGAADMFQWWLFMATDVIGELSFGESFRMLENGKKNQYSYDLEQIAGFQPFRTTFPLIVKLAKYVTLPFFWKISAAGQRMGKYAQASIDRYQSILARDGQQAKETLFSKVWTKSELTADDIRNEAQGYIVAGSDTTAVTMTYLLYSVLKHEDVRKKLLAELDTLPVNYTDKDLRQLRYMDQVIHETLRLYAPVPSALPRAVPPGGAQLAGYNLPGGVTVSTQAYTLHRMVDVWPNPERFDPERWASPSKEMKEVFMAFGGGSRVCLGIHLARMELRIATARFFQKFPTARLSTKEGMSAEDMESVCYFLMAPKGHRLLLEA